MNFNTILIIVCGLLNAGFSRSRYFSTSRCPAGCEMVRRHGICAVRSVLYVRVYALHYATLYTHAWLMMPLPALPSDHGHLSYGPLSGPLSTPQCQWPWPGTGGWRGWGYRNRGRRCGRGDVHNVEDTTL